MKLGNHQAGRLLFARIDELDAVSEAALRARVGLDCLIGILASADSFEDFADLYDFVTDDAAFVVESELRDVAFCEFEVTRALLERAVERTDLAAQALAEVIETDADRQAVVGECRLAAAVSDQQEELRGPSGPEGFRQP